MSIEQKVFFLLSDYPETVLHSCAERLATKSTWQQHRAALAQRGFGVRGSGVGLFDKDLHCECLERLGLIFDIRFAKVSGPAPPGAMEQADNIPMAYYGDYSAVFDFYRAALLQTDLMYLPESQRLPGNLFCELTHFFENKT